MMAIVARWIRRAAAAALLFALQTAPASAHPHAFVDGGVDFVFGDGGVLEELEVTWLVDEFETLYLVSAYDLSLNDTGDLDEPDRLKLVRKLREWVDGFDGSAHLSIGGERVPLTKPHAFDAKLVNGRLEMTLSRELERPLALSGRTAEVAFYEASYFYALSIAREPQLRGLDANCGAQVVLFDPSRLVALQTTLMQLGREETPEVEDVGSLFADRIVLECASS